MISSMIVVFSVTSPGSGLIWELEVTRASMDYLSRSACGSEATSP